jgi:hypothetical protein
LKYIVYVFWTHNKYIVWLCENLFLTYYYIWATKTTSRIHTQVTSLILLLNNHILHPPLTTDEPDCVFCHFNIITSRLLYKWNKLLHNLLRLDTHVIVSIFLVCLKYIFYFLKNKYLQITLRMAFTLLIVLRILFHYYLFILLRTVYTEVFFFFFAFVCF